MIESIAPIAPPAPPHGAAVQAPAVPKLRSAMSGARRFIVQFASGTPLPDGDEITCTPEALEGIIPGEVQRSLNFSDATAWLARLYPCSLAALLDDEAAQYGDESRWPGARRPGFSRYYQLRFTGGLDDAHIIGTLSRASTIAMVQPEYPLEVQAPKDNPDFANQEYLQPAPEGISAQAAWAAGATGSGITIGFAEPGIKPPKHPDISIAASLGQGPSGSDHMLNIAGILGANDNTQGIIGVAYNSTLVFSATDAIPAANAPKVPASTTVTPNGFVAIALLATTKALKAGDVVNFSIGARVELDQTKSPKVGPTLPATRPRRSGNGKMPIAVKPDGTYEHIAAPIPLEIDAALLALMRQLASKGVTVCMAAGNGYEAAYSMGTKTTTVDTGVGIDTSIHCVGETHRLDRSDPAFMDGGAIVVSGMALAPKITRVSGFNFGNRIDCFAQGHDVTTWDTTKTVRVSGTSAASPIVAGAAALLQCFAKQTWQASLKPQVMRALLSDPVLNTGFQPDAQIGFMPDLTKLIALLRTGAPDKTKLMTALKDRAAKAATEVARLKTLAAAATPPVNWVHNPYTVWDETTKKWVAMPFGSEADVFNPNP
ncbi:MAG: S8 family serine peptidase [Cytophagales bacterium]|nr:S8 family serine peptidase [Rhizobacter sp.]